MNELMPMFFNRREMALLSQVFHFILKNPVYVEAILEETDEEITQELLDLQKRIDNPA